MAQLPLSSLVDPAATLLIQKWKSILDPVLANPLLSQVAYSQGTFNFQLSNGQPAQLGAAGLTANTPSGGGSLLPTGVILSYPNGPVPSGFLATDGSLVSRVTYAALFIVIGITSGAGDGSTTFELPTVSASIIKT